MTDALVFEGVTKRYARGAPPALDGLSFTVPAGVVCGFVGPNGAGKTTAFSVLSGFLPVDAGRVDLLGLGAYDPWRMKGRVGVLPQDALLPERHTAVELLTHLGRLQGMAGDAAHADAVRLVHALGLTEKIGARIGALSHGMQRRVAVATALIGGPELVVLDEPTAGLDPVQARGLRDLLRGLRGRQTLIISSHNLLELEQLCDWVVMIDRGRCVRQGSVAEVTGRSERIVWELGPGLLDLDALRVVLPGADIARDGAVLTTVAAAGTDLDALTVVVMRALAEAGVPLRGLRRGVSLEDRFIDDAAGTAP